MISRAEYIHTKSRVKRLEDQVNKLARSAEPEWAEAQKTYREWVQYLNLSRNEQDWLMQEWNEYYAKVQRIYNDAGFSRLSELFYSKEHHMSMRSVADSIIAEAKQSPEPAKPKMADPISWNHNSIIQKYLQMKRDIRELKATIDEYTPVYEPKSKLELDPADFY